MEKEAFEDYIENRYKNQLAYYELKSVRNHTRYNWFQWVLIILSAMAPVLAALSGKSWSHEGSLHTFSDSVIQVLLVVVSSIVAILTTALKTFQYQELWLKYRITYEQLKPEIHYYTYNIGPYSEPGINKEALFVSRVENILNKEHQQWPPAKDQNTLPKDQQ